MHETKELSASAPSAYESYEFDLKRAWYISDPKLTEEVAKSAVEKDEVCRIILIGIPGVGKSAIVEQLAPHFSTDYKPSVDYQRRILFACQAHALLADKFTKPIAAILQQENPRSGYVIKSRRLAHCWLRSSNAGSVLWINGGGGTGKSTLSSFMSMNIPEPPRLGSMVFCSREQDAASVIVTIATDLASRIPGYQIYFARLLEEDENRMNQGLPSMLALPCGALFKKLVLDGLECNEFALDKKFVIILDGVDEIGKTGDRERNHMLELIHELQFLPPFIKVIVTARPEVDIWLTMRKMRNLVVLEFPNNDVSEDVASYISLRLDQLGVSGLELADLTQQLVAKSLGVFLWARVACDYLENCFPLESTLQFDSTEIEGKVSNLPSGIGSLYDYIIHAASLKLGKYKDDVEIVLRVICFHREPLLVGEISDLAGISEERVDAVVLLVRCLLNFDINERATFIHKSLREIFC